MSAMRLNVDVRPPPSSCAWQPPANFSASDPLPWPVKPEYQDYTTALLKGDMGEALMVINFNKRFREAEAIPTDLSYHQSVAVSGMAHGFVAAPSFSCQLQSSGAHECASIQLTGTAFMGYDEMLISFYPSRRAHLSMVNYPAYDFSLKEQNLQWYRGVATVPLPGSAGFVTKPQPVGPSFAERTGFAQPDVTCIDAVKRGEESLAIVSSACYPRLVANAGMIGMEAQPCFAMFSPMPPSVCPAACEVRLGELATCLEAMPLQYTTMDASFIESLRSNPTAPQETWARWVGQLSMRGFWLEALRRGCQPAPPSQI